MYIYWCDIAELGQLLEEEILKKWSGIAASESRKRKNNYADSLRSCLRIAWMLEDFHLPSHLTAGESWRQRSVNRSFWGRWSRSDICQRLLVENHLRSRQGNGLYRSNSACDHNWNTVPCRKTLVGALCRQSQGLQLDLVSGFHPLVSQRWQCSAPTRWSTWSRNTVPQNMIITSKWKRRITHDKLDDQLLCNCPQQCSTHLHVYFVDGSSNDYRTCLKYPPCSNVGPDTPIS